MFKSKKHIKRVLKVMDKAKNDLKGTEDHREQGVYVGLEIASALLENRKTDYSDAHERVDSNERN